MNPAALQNLHREQFHREQFLRACADLQTAYDHGLGIVRAGVTLHRLKSVVPRSLHRHIPTHKTTPTP